MVEDRGASVYSFDTNSFMTVDNLAKPEPVWQLIVRLIQAGRLYTVSLVFDELKWNEATDVLARLNPYRSQIVVPQAELFGTAGVLALNYQQMAKPLSWKDRADTWVIALAQQFGYTVVTEEKDYDDRKPRSMSYVCRQEGIACCNLAGFCTAEQ